VKRRISLIWLGLLVALGPAVAAAQDPLRIAADKYHQEFENQWVRVLRLKLGPRDKAPRHDQGESIVVFLTPAHERLASPGKPAQEITRKGGEVAHFGAFKGTEENLSAQPLESVIVELKPAAPDAAPWPPALDPMKLDPAHHSVLFENERVRVLRTVLEPHLKGPLHEHPHYVVVYLTDLHTTMTMADGRAVDNPRRPGDVAWRDPLKHITENIGDREAVEIQVELK
jgi:quercetin dioxygenase-like cupin family protein